MARPASLADRFRANREAFELGLKLGCTPREAKEKLRQAELRRRREDWLRREAAERAPRNVRICGTLDDGPVDPWWKRD